MKLLAIIAFIICGGNAFADHTNPGEAAEELLYESQELDQMVRYSTLRYEVKYSVSTFEQDVERLAYCLKSYDHTCGDDMQRAQYSFSQVSRYLHDTQYDYPQIYRQWLHTRYALQETEEMLNNNQPQPQPQFVRCTAYDTGWEEHSGGHTAYGRDIREAQYSALRECQRFHPGCRITSCQ